MMPSAPGRFSTTTGTFQNSRSFSAMMRARMSVVPPGWKPTTMRTVRDGKSVWANAEEVSVATSARSASSQRQVGNFIAISNERVGRRSCAYKRSSSSLHAARLRRSPCAFNELPHPRRRQRQVAHLYTERGERRRHRIADRRRDRDQAAFAGAPGAERIAFGARKLDADAADVRIVARGRQQIVGKRSGEKLAALVVDEVLEECAAEPLHDRAQRLAVHDERIEDTAEVFHADEINEPDLADARID